MFKRLSLPEPVLAVTGKTHLLGYLEHYRLHAYGHIPVKHLNRLWDGGHGGLAELAGLCLYVGRYVRQAPSLPYTGIRKYVIGKHGGVAYYYIGAYKERDLFQVPQCRELAVGPGGGQTRSGHVHPDHLCAVRILTHGRGQDLLVHVAGKRIPRPFCRVAGKERGFFV